MTGCLTSSMRSPARHRVIIFDNAGIGQTTMPAGTLSVSGMADQTAALITALGLKHPDVLGWSMGGMVAQALAVLHPGDVHRLVLSATYSGNGKATSPSPANASALLNAAKTGDTNAIMALIFPANQLATQESAYIHGVSGYPNFYQAPESLAVAQHAAISSWAAGAVAAGHGHISAPTLIGDGADDVMTPPANVHKMVEEIRGAHSVIYPDAGHGFLFQDFDGLGGSDQCLFDLVESAGRSRPLIMGATVRRDGAAVRHLHG